ncbi:MAG: ComEC/Rec2 family competence protein [Aristaeellaceae bacterium]
MKKRFRRLLAGALTVLMCGTAQAQVELFAVNVGKGDALVVRAGDYTCLIDTGKEKAQEQLEVALKALGVEALDAVFITHTDKDHVGGLKWLRESDIEIRAIYASRYYPNTTEKKHPAVKAAKKLDLTVNWLGAGDSVPLGDSGAVFRVLAPAMEIPDDEDDNSLVMMLESPDGRILLTGDMEHVEEAALLASGVDLRCDVLKVANHGDSDATSAALIAACAPSVALISTDSAEKPGTPDAGIVRNLQGIGCAVCVTQDASLGIRVKLDGGRVAVENVNP